jgi:hypothetical protein
MLKPPWTIFYFNGLLDSLVKMQLLLMLCLPPVSLRQHSTCSTCCNPTRLLLLLLQLRLLLRLVNYLRHTYETSKVCYS